MLKALRESTVKQRLFRQGKEQKPKCLDQKTCVVCNEKSLQVSFKAKEKKKRKVHLLSLQERKRLKQGKLVSRQLDIQLVVFLI